MCAQQISTVTVLALVMAAGCQTLDVHRPVQSHAAAPVTINPDVATPMTPDTANGQEVVFSLGAGDRFGELLWSSDRRQLPAPDAQR